MVQIYYQCLEFAITAHFNRLLILVLALKTKTCTRHFTIDLSSIEI